MFAGSRQLLGQLSTFAGVWSDFVAALGVQLAYGFHEHLRRYSA